MTKILVDAYKTDKTINYANVLFILLGIFVQQASVTTFGNLSIADIILVFLLVYLAINKMISFNKLYFTTFFFFLAYLLIISVFYAPVKFNVIIDERRLFIEIIKLIVLFLYFYIGTTIVKENKFEYFIKIYSNFVVAIAISGIILSFFKIPILYEIFFKYGGRLTGFMNDPNYFALLQVSGLPFFLKNNQMNGRKRMLAILSIILSVMLSASKTGALTMVIYLSIMSVEKRIIASKAKTLKDHTINYLSIIFLSGLIFLLFSNLTTIVEFLNHYFPVTQRMTNLFTDFTASITSDGSDRLHVWAAGLGVIRETPFIGIGLGNYFSITDILSGVTTVAHNTYIQLAVEWGLPLALLFFSIIFIKIFVSTFKYSSNLKLSIQKDILIILLVGSISISLNNARLFWIVLGALMYTMNIQKESSTYN